MDHSGGIEFDIMLYNTESNPQMLFGGLDYPRYVTQYNSRKL